MSHDLESGPRRARELFARAADGLDHGMAFRLRRARAQAQQAPARQRPVWFSLVPTGAAAAAALALGLAWWLPGREPMPGATPVAVDEQEIEQLLAGDDDPAMYAWLAEAPVATGRGR